MLAFASIRHLLLLGAAMTLNFQLVDSGWDQVLHRALQEDHSAVRIVCPFIKRRAMERFLDHGVPGDFQVITRFNLGDFSEGVSDIAALKLLLERGAQIRGVRHLHAKLYLFGQSRVVVTSANLTDAALMRNQEFGFVAEDAGIVRRCHEYFERLWDRAGNDLSAARLKNWQRKVTNYLASGVRPAAAAALGDEGVDARIPTEPVEVPAWVDEAGQAFVKFFGQSHNRTDRSVAVFIEVERSGCHWACTYPKNKRPRRVQDGAVMFMGRLVENPHDILIYGRAVGMRYEPGRDDATAADIRRRSWKDRWPHYVRVHHAEFVEGTLSNGVSLGELVDALNADAFASTQRNAAKGEGNTDPRIAYRQQAAVELSRQGMEWLNERLERAYAQHGKLAPTKLQQLDWPTIPSQAG